MNDYAISVENLTKFYNDFSALNNISFRIKRGDFFGIIGPNGAGKTTILKILYSVVIPSAGSIDILGLSPTNDSKKIKSRLGVVPQDDNLDEDLSVFENLIIYSMYFGINKKESFRRVSELLDFFNIAEKKDSKVINLSGGYRRRLLLARALINSPDIIILDEPTIGLDPEYRLNIWNKLKLLNKSGITILMSTHYMDEAEKLFRNVILLNHGKIVLNGSMDYILNKNNNENINGASNNMAYKKEDVYNNNKGLKSLEEIFMDIVKNENFKSN
ncbi:MAG: ABC transporter ATP-binding protein [Candidatus Acididesulfobacter guangdongensis]|uniref:ABC transporter ATP-binding protein n=1 Tax=Acididesulfobacter guangdongensis TaxID=2597225 RepID=A0A519BG63_ACIG2|nr:MAG: ABC transporter ATP-binding protein [Candidatus Acididesulfobacter guangdongensis]